MYESFVSQYFEEVVLPGDVGVLLKHLEHLDEFVGLVGGRVSDAGEHPAVEVLGLDGDHVGGLRDEVERADGDGDGEGGGEGANHHQDDHEDQLERVVPVLLRPLTRHLGAVAHCIQCGHDEEVDVQVELGAEHRAVLPALHVDQQAGQEVQKVQREEDHRHQRYEVISHLRDRRALEERPEQLG